MAYTPKNYMENGGDKFVIGGALEIKSGATVTGLPTATATTAGAVKVAANVAEAAGDAPTATEYKALLDALKTAGLMVADS